MKKRQAKPAVELLECLLADVKELAPEKIRRSQNTTPLALVAKADVLELINDWIQVGREQ